MKVLVTGATGFVGSAVVRRLCADGETVHALVRDETRAAELRATGAEIFVGDIGDPNDVLRAAKGCRLAVHAAAVATHRAAERALTWTNVAGTENVLRAARHAGIARVVHVSCADVTLTNEDRVHWDEDRSSPRGLLDAHARTKRLAEEVALTTTAEGFEVCAVRPAFLWGPGDFTHAPALCREALEHGGLALFGDGTNLVASTYIDNLVDAITDALVATNVASRAYYVADADFLDARELYGMLSAALGLPKPRGGLPFEAAYALAWARERAGGTGPWRTDVVRRARSSQFDVQRATSDLGWKARVSVKDGMAALAAWTTTLGGPAALAAKERPPPTAASVDAQVAAAGGDV